MSKDWAHGTFGCTSDMGTCCMGTFCSCCLIYTNAEEMGESGFLYLLLSCITPCVPVMMLRTKAREAYGIEGSTTDDALMACCCNCCALVQTTNEIKEHKK
eukprot:GFUD01000032.1.p1 GENE.GFUD01000032.1~~GFUD01000032.1.p1  ORF type:complete len:101 (+),score=19.20 GFUD01000032.1:86-388(+)